MNIWGMIFTFFMPGVVFGMLLMLAIFVSFAKRCRKEEARRRRQNLRQNKSEG